MANVKVKGPVDSVRKLLSGGVDSIHGHGGTKETKKKVSQSQRFNPRQKPVSSGAPPAEYGARWRYSEQPQSGM